MGKVLRASDNRVRVISPTTTAALARRMLKASEVIARHVPAHFTDPTPLHILLTLFEIEEEAGQMSCEDLFPIGNMPDAVAQRWLKALVEHGWVEQRLSQLGLSQMGYDAISAMIEELYGEQRALDVCSAGDQQREPPQIRGN